MAKQAKVLSSSELKRVYAIAESSKHPLRNKLILALSFNAGLRACEIAALRIGDVVDAKGNVLESFVLEAAQTKGSERHTAYLSKKVRKAIRDYLDATEGLTERQRGRKLIQSQKGGGFTSATIQQLFKELYKQAAIPNASSHSGRRSFITNLASKGVGVSVIRELARHSNLATTQRYIEVSSDKLSNAVELVD